MSHRSWQAGGSRRTIATNVGTAASMGLQYVVGYTVFAVRWVFALLYQIQTANRVAAVVFWLIGAWATSVFMAEIGITTESHWHHIAGLIAQFVLTVLEKPIFRFRKFGPLPLAGIVIDVIFNAGGLWSYLRNLGRTQAWQMLAEVTVSTPEPSAPTRFVVAVGLGFITAIASDILWNW